MSTTLKSTLRLDGDELADARSLTLWGMHDAAFSYRDCVLPGGASSADNRGGPGEQLITTCDLSGALALSSGDEEMWRDLSHADVETLERLARSEIHAQTFIDGEPPAVAAQLIARAEVARRVLVTVRRLQAALPPLLVCQECGRVLPS